MHTVEFQGEVHKQSAQCATGLGIGGFDCETWQRRGRRNTTFMGVKCGIPEDFVTIDVVECRSISYMVHHAVATATINNNL